LIKANLRLTVRDLEVMKDIYDHQFLSFYQVHEKHFPENKRPTVYNRLSKLIRAEIIKAVNVNLVAYHRKGELLGVIYVMTKDGLRRLQDFKMMEDINQNQVSLNFNCLYHDLLLTDVLRVLKMDWNVKKPIKENQNRIPDAVLFDQRSNKKMAFELELTAKSEMRYREIILSYRTSNEFDSVLYVVKDESIQKKIGGLITGFNGRYEIGDDTDKFKFMTLTQILNSHKEENVEL
jgi:Fe2+ or Zn2+ uptake regulation protein